jgi:methyl-accepting chemotaxis protein
MYTTISALTIVLNGVLFIFGSFWISKYISSPVKTLIEAIEGVYNGNFNIVTTIKTHDEIGRFQDVYNTTIQKIQQPFQTSSRSKKRSGAPSWKSPLRKSTRISCTTRSIPSTRWP